MVARLPTPGGDDGDWGDILNTFLEVSLNSDGTIQPTALTQAGGVTSVNSITPSNGNVALTPAAIGSGTPSSSNFLRGDGTWAVPSGGVTLDSTAGDIQPDTTTGTSVAGSVGKAADAGHQHSLVSHDHSTTAKGGNIPESSVTNLTTDLAAKAPIASPTFTGKVTTPALQVTTGAGTALQVLTSDSSGNATWANQLVEGIQVNGWPVQTGAVNLSVAQQLVPTTVQTYASSPITAAVGQFIPVDTTNGNVVVTLPTSPLDGSRIEVKMVKQGSTNTVTINAGGSNTFNDDSSTSATLKLLNQAVMLQWYAATPGVWYVQGDDLPLSQLDSRYLQQTSLPLGITSGGTGQASAAAAYNALSPMTTLGDIEYESGTNTASRLAGNTTTTKKFLTQTGTGSVSAAPSWNMLATSDIPQLADYAPTGLTGATAVSRYVGATTSGAPTSGTFAVGDHIIDQSGKIWICTSAGTPGTWAQVGGSTSYNGIFGDGSDGSAPLDGSTSVGWASLAGSTYTMTADCWTTSLTINNGVTLLTAGWRIFFYRHRNQ